MSIGLNEDGSTERVWEKEGKKGGGVKRGKETKREIKEGKSEGKRQRIKRERGRRLRDREGEEAIEQDSVYH